MSTCTVCSRCVQETETTLLLGKNFLYTSSNLSRHTCDEIHTILCFSPSVVHTSYISLLYNPTPSVSSSLSHLHSSCVDKFYHSVHSLSIIYNCNLNFCRKSHCPSNISFTINPESVRHQSVSHSFPFQSSQHH
jgi:hypothetical protein